MRKEKDWSQSQLATNSGVSREMNGKYERGEAVPSLDAAKKIVKAFGVTLDYLAGETSDMAFDSRTIERFQDIEKLSESKKDHVFALLDAFLVKRKMHATLK